jgi:predicted transcriptional regulator
MSSSPETFSVRLPPELRSELDRFATESKRSRSFVIKEAVAAYIQEHRAYEEAVEEALAEADKGVFVSGEATMKWLASWGSTHVLPAPEADIFPKKP